MLKRIEIKYIAIFIVSYIGIEQIKPNDEYNFLFAVYMALGASMLFIFNSKATNEKNPK